MSPLSNASNNNGNNNSNNSIQTNTLSLSSGTNSSSSAFKPLINENRQLNMLTSSSGLSAMSASSIDHYSNDLTSPYGSGYHHHHHLNSQLNTQDYLNAHHHQAAPLPIGVYKSEHDDLQGYSFARPVKLFDHTSPSTGMDTGGNTLHISGSALSTTPASSASGLHSGSAASANSQNTTSVANGSSEYSSGASSQQHQNGFRGDAPSPGASIIDLSTSSVTSLRSGAGAAGFPNGSYYDGQRYDRSPQSASSPHYSSPQMLSPQGQTLDLSVGRTK